jgi:hypothetical protein
VNDAEKKNHDDGAIFEFIASEFAADYPDLAGRAMEIAASLRGVPAEPVKDPDAGVHLSPAERGLVRKHLRARRDQLLKDAGADEALVLARLLDDRF